jgi:hypothetical protein
MFIKFGNFGTFLLLKRNDCFPAKFEIFINYLINNVASARQMSQILQFDIKN